MKMMLGLSGMLLASGIVIAADYSKLSNEDVMQSLQDDSIVRNERESRNNIKDEYSEEKQLFFTEFTRRIENADSKEKEKPEKAFKA